MRPRPSDAINVRVLKMSVLDDILKHPRFDNDKDDDNGREHKADWKGDWGRNNDGDGGHWQDEGKFCWKDDGDKKWDAKNDDCESGGGDPEGCGDLSAVLASLTDAVEVIQKAIEGLDCTQPCEAHAESFDNDSLAA
jgi:hypothetical protein